MRILYLTESMGWSGGAQQTLWMARALRDRGHDLVLACQPASEILARAGEERIPTVLVRMRQDYDLPAVLRTAGVLRECGADVLHAQHSTAHAIGLMAAALSGVPVFAVTRRVTFTVRQNPFSRLKYRSRRVDGYVAISEAVKAALVAAGIEDARIEVIPSVIGMRVANHQQGLETRRALNLPEDAPLVTCIGNYADFKGQDYFIRAAAEVKPVRGDVRFLLAGRDVEKLAPLVGELGLTETVRLAGFRRDVPQLLAASDVFVIPSLQEAAATSLREAMLTGLPCVGTSVGGIPESIANGDTGLLVPPGNPGALASAILYLLTNRQEASAMGARARVRAETLWSVPEAAGKMEAFYGRLLERSGKVPATA